MTDADDQDVRGATKEEELLEEHSPHTADRAATPEEEQAADRGRERFEDEAEEAADNVRSMAERGAHVEGEGEVR